MNMYFYATSCSHMCLPIPQHSRHFTAFYSMHCIPNVMPVAALFIGFVHIVPGLHAYRGFIRSLFTSTVTFSCFARHVVQ